MNSVQQRFLDQFEPTVATGIIEFCKALSRVEADVFLVMARKAACFIDSLRKLSLLNIDAYVTTERILDMDCNWLAGKNVVIIDDAIISGTTINRTLETLLSFRVKDVKVLVLCINKEWFEKSLIDNQAKIKHDILQEPYLQLSDSECIRACSDIITSFSVLPRPYDIDFPYFKHSKINSKEFLEIIRHQEWEADEVSSQAQADNDVFSITMTPKLCAKARFDESIGYRISDKAMLKLRLYGRYLDEAKEKISLQIVSFVILKPIEAGYVERLFDNLKKRVGLGNDLSDAFVGPLSKMRLIQYMLGVKLFQSWYEPITEIIRKNIDANLGKEEIYFLFPQEVSEVIYRNAFSATKIMQGGAAIYIDPPVNRAAVAKYKDKYSDDIIGSVACLVKPFLDLYYEKELRARKLAKSYGAGVFNRIEYKKVVDRLNIGYSISDLKEMIKNKVGYNHDKLLSIFLDVAIDAGIVVPITAEIDGYLCRAFRHGEDVQFGEKEEKLAHVLIKTVTEVANIKHIPQIWAEKLLVLFVKICIQNRVMKPFLYCFNYDDKYKTSDYYSKRLVSVRTWLHGPVAIHRNLDLSKTFDSEISVAENKSLWLTKLLEDKGIINTEIVEGEKFYTVGEAPNIICDTVSEGKVENIGEIFGRILNQKSPLKGVGVFSDRQLVQLSACLLPHDVVGALGVEIYLFCKNWDNYNHRWRINKDKYGNFLYLASQLRRRDNFFFTAINSGQAKYFWFKEREADRLIAKVEEAFENRIYKNTWNEFWSPNRNWEEGTLDRNTLSLIDLQGLWLVSANVYVRLLDYCLRDIGDIENSAASENDEFKIKLLNELKGYFQKLLNFNNNPRAQEIIPFIRQIISDIDKNVFDASRNIENIYEKITRLLYTSKAIIDDTELIINSWGKIEEIHRFSNTLFVDIDEAYPNEKEHVWVEVQRQFTQFKAWWHENAQELGDLPSVIVIPGEKNIFRRGFWIVTSGSSNHKFLVRLASEIFRKISPLANTRVVLFTQHSEESRIKISGKNNTNLKFGYFWDKVALLGTAFEGLISKSELIIITEVKSGIKNEFEKLSVKEKALYSFSESFDIVLPFPYDCKYCIQKFTENKRISMTMDACDVGIITVVPSESRAVIEGIINQTRTPGKKTRRIYRTGLMEGYDGHMHRVVQTQQLGQGNRAVINAFHHMIDEFNPKLMVLLGIAGGISDDLELCDVVIGSQIIYYETRKETAKATEREGKAYDIPATIEPYIDEFFIHHGENARVEAALGSFKETFAIKKGPIGSGEAVIADKASEIRAWLQRFSRKTMAIEMEAGGFAQAFKENELKIGHGQVGFLIIRGISDHADFDKDDKWRIPASQNAHRTLQEILKQTPALE